MAGINQHIILASTAAIMPGWDCWYTLRGGNEDPTDITDVRQWDELGTSLAEVRPFTIKQYQKTDRVALSEADYDLMQKFKAILWGDIRCSATVPDGNSWIRYHYV